MPVLPPHEGRCLAVGWRHPRKHGLRCYCSIGGWPAHEGGSCCNKKVYAYSPDRERAARRVGVHAVVERGWFYIKKDRVKRSRVVLPNPCP